MIVHKKMYRDKKNNFTFLITEAKKEHYRTKISESSGDQKQLFRCIDELLNKSKSSALPSSESDQKLANDMSSFFLDKVKKIRKELEELQSTGKSSTSYLDPMPTPL